MYMAKVYVFLIDGFEEIEALTAVDVLRRADCEVVTVSLNQETIVTGGHRVPVVCDARFEDLTFADVDLLLLPGGTVALAEHEGLKTLVASAASQNKLVAAICAAPMVLGQLGVLKGRKATCYPGFESYLEGAEVLTQNAVCDGNIITGRAPGASMHFALAVVEKLVGKDKADELAAAMCVTR